MEAVWNLVIAFGAAAVIIGLVGAALTEPGRCRCRQCRGIR